MAVPAEITALNINGTYTLNKSLSDSSQATLKMQNVGWLVRQAVQYSNIDATLHQYTGDNPTKPGEQVQRLDQHQTSTGNVKNLEERIMDWQWATTNNKIWGEVRGKSRYCTLAEVEGDEWLLEGWDESCTGEGGKVVESLVEGIKDGWTAHQIWGFAVVDGQRRHVRRIVAKRKGWKEEKVRMAYDWKGPAENVGGDGQA